MRGRGGVRERRRGEEKGKGGMGIGVRGGGRWGGEGEGKQPGLGVWTGPGTGALDTDLLVVPIGKACNNGKYGYICLLCASPAGTKSTRIFNLKGGAEVHARSCTGGLKKPDGGRGVRPGWEQERPLVVPPAVDCDRRSVV